MKIECQDYIFIKGNGNDIAKRQENFPKVFSYLSIPEPKDQSTFTLEKGLPCQNYPSDHFAIAFEYLV